VTKKGTNGHHEEEKRTTDRLLGSSYKNSTLREEGITIGITVPEEKRKLGSKEEGKVVRQI